MGTRREAIPIYSSDSEISISLFILASSARFVQTMIVEEARLRTFQNWPRYLAVRPIELARVGFYHLGSADLVRCAFCGGVLRDWEEAESSVAEHWRYFSSCEFLRGTNQSNVPIIPNDSYIHDYVSTHPLSSTDEDVRAALNPLSTILDSGNLNLVQSDAPATAEDLGIITQTASQPDKAILTTRVATFANWPRRSPLPSKEQIAEAGFYYLDREDAVKCFFCGGVLKSWRDEDIPWKEHAKWFPKCAYLLRIKGQEFVDTIHQPGTGTAKVVGTNGYPGVTGQLYKNGSDLPNAASDMDSVTIGLRIKINDDVMKTGHPVVTDKNNHVPTGTLAAAEAAPAKQQASEAATEARTDAIPQQGEESSELLRENEELKEQRLCKICMDAESNIVLLPCGHLVSCELCAPVLTKCPRCCKAVRGSVKTYLS
ncbi:baculoviral IAP repeat-containing protein 3 [Patella vulgata]|uniref:baculoviral IAP repeat-containing protein 3 n=1 Tax=Patella vulgata TaxID=6465 RepID=UPI0024A82B3A|nr:baculoviral IAP repeat-containing protein 3 [Patella vulgata]XP_055959187.1 baculoviral IAP repeat-containing protein 3 [Patella vulgata]